MMTISENDWNALNDRVNFYFFHFSIDRDRFRHVHYFNRQFCGIQLLQLRNLEMRVETQNEYYKKTTEQLKLTLVKEIEMRLEMKKEMDKLMELVTQV